MTYLEMAEKVLQDTSIKIPLTFTEIWKQAVKKGCAKDTTGKTPEQSLGANLFVNVRDKKDSKFLKIGSRPTKFWLKARQNELKGVNLEFSSPKNENKSEKQKDDKDSFHERDLHPLLVKFLNIDESFKLHAKTIYHEKCLKKEQGRSKWNYPDIVGVKFPFDKEVETLNLLSNINQGEYNLYSFELKKSINFSNLKEYYFQAVSNSSWANEGYLVVFENIDKEMRDELKRLNASFGIGVIQLDVDVFSTEVILPAMQRNLDIETLNMLVEESPDFKNFVVDINRHIKAKAENLGDIKDKFDEIFSDEKLEKYLKEKHIDRE